MTKCSFTAMASAAVALLLASAALAGDVRLASPGGGAIVLTSPDDWRHAKWPDMANTLSFTPPKGNAFQVLVTSLGLPPAHVKPGPEVLRQMVDEAARNAAPQSVEKTLRTEEFETAGSSEVLLRHRSQSQARGVQVPDPGRGAGSGKRNHLQHPQQRRRERSRRASAQDDPDRTQGVNSAAG